LGDMPAFSSIVTENTHNIHRRYRPHLILQDESVQLLLA
jgi:hypothetical protein